MVEPEGEEKAACQCPVSKKRSKWMKFLLCVTQTEKPKPYFPLPLQPRDQGIHFFGKL